MLEKTKKFVKEHKKAVVMTAVVAGGALGYYALGRRITNGHSNTYRYFYEFTVGGLSMDDYPAIVDLNKELSENTMETLKNYSDRIPAIKNYLENIDMNTIRVGL